MKRTVSVNLPWSTQITLSVSGPPALIRALDGIGAAARFIARATSWLKWLAIQLFQPALWALALLVLLSRDPYRLLDAQLWAEDGPLWIYDAYMTGLPSLLIPHTGYLQTFPRLVGFSTDIAPLAWVPTIFALAGFLTQVAPAWMLLSARGRQLIPSLPARLILGAFYLGVPNSFETFVNITNAQWHVAIIMFLILVLQPPKHRAWRIAEYTYLVIGGLSGPFCFFLAPIAWWQARSENQLRGPRALQAAWLSLTALIQAGYVLFSAGSARHLEPLGATLAGFARILDGQVFLATIGGAGQVSRFETHFMIWQNNLCPILILPLFLFVLAAATLKGPKPYRLLVAFAALIMAAALWSPVISTTQPQWDALEVPGAGSRYYLLPILAWFTGMLVLAGDRNKLIAGLATLLILLCAVGVRTDWHYGRQPETHFVAAAQTFAASPPGTTVIFREAPNPAVWLFSLTKK